MFDGLTLSAGLGGGKDHAPAPIAPDAPPCEQDTLSRAVDHYTQAWTDAWRMQEQGLPVLEHQKVALRDATTALDGVKPGVLRDLNAVLRYEPAVYDAMTQMQGPTRTTLLVTSLAHGDRVWWEPKFKAERPMRPIAVRMPDARGRQNHSAGRGPVHISLRAKLPFCATMIRIGRRRCRSDCQSARPKRCATKKVRAQVDPAHNLATAILGINAICEGTCGANR
jgi:hypothetical protein